MSIEFKPLASQDLLEAYYANVQRSETIHMVMLDTDGRVVAANRATARLFGTTPDDLTGKDWFLMATVPTEQEAMKSQFRRFLATGLPDVSQYSLRLPNGTQRIMLWSNSLTRDVDILTGTLSFGIDVTEHELDHEQLRRQNLLLQRAEEVAGLGTYILDVTAGKWTSSALLDQIFGIDAMYPRTVEGWLDIVHPDDRAMMATYFSEHVLGQKNTFDKRYRIVRKSDGAVRILQGFGQLEMAGDGSVVRMMGTIQDITNREHQPKP